MKKNISPLFIAISLFFIWAGAPSAALAALGETAVTLTALPARQMAASHIGLSVRTSQLASGTVVREYIDSSGKVVAVAWQGPTLPDLQQLLGSYFPRYTQAQASKSSDASHRHAQLSDTDVVVESHGHMRAFVGRAYLPALLPTGFTSEQIQ